jgi:hypothetical protein
MATAKQTAANRENAKKSTGPSTPEGKAKSCMNHLSHGFASATGFIPTEDQEEFEGLLDDLLNHFQPANPHEQILVEKMAHAQWNSLRGIGLQSMVLTASLPHGYVHKDLGILIRYQTAADRAYHKAHAELVKAQKERAKSEIGFESQSQSQAPADPPQTPAPTEKPAPSFREMPTFVPYEVELAEQLGVSVHELLDVA